MPCRIGIVTLLPMSEVLRWDTESLGVSVGRRVDILGSLVGVLPWKVFGDYTVECHVHVSGSVRGRHVIHRSGRPCHVSTTHDGSPRIKVLIDLSLATQFPEHPQ